MKLTEEHFKWVWNKPNHRYIDDEYIVQANYQINDYHHTITCSRVLRLLNKNSLEIINEVNI